MQNDKIEYIPCQDEYRKVILMEQVNDCLVVTHADTLPEAQRLFETATTTVIEQDSPTVLV